MGQNLVILRSDDSIVDQSYLRWALRSPQYWREVDRYLNVGAVFSSLNCRDIPLFEIPVPSLPTQRRISAFLVALDDKIELNKRMNATIDALVGAAFAARVGSDGATKSVGDLVELSWETFDPQASPDAVFDHFSIPAFDAAREPSRETGRAIKSTKLRVPAGSVLLSKLNPRIPRVWLPDIRDGRAALCSTEFLVCVPRPQFDAAFVYAFLSSPTFRTEFATLVTGTSGSHQRVKRADFLTFPAPAPPADAVAAFSDVAQPLLDRMLNNRRESETLAQLRDTLLPKLVSGELRLRDAEALLEPTGSERTQASLSSERHN